MRPPVTAEEFPAILAAAQAAGAEEIRRRNEEAARRRNEAQAEADRLLAVVALTDGQRRALGAWLRHLDLHHLDGDAWQVADYLDPPHPED